MLAVALVTNACEDVTFKILFGEPGAGHRTISFINSIFKPQPLQRKFQDQVVSVEFLPTWFEIGGKLFGRKRSKFNGEIRMDGPACCRPRANPSQCDALAQDVRSACPVTTMQSSKELLECCDRFAEKAANFATNIAQMSEILRTVETTLFSDQENVDLLNRTAEKCELNLPDEEVVSLLSANSSESKPSDISRLRRSHRPGSELLWPGVSQNVPTSSTPVRSPDHPKKPGDENDKQLNCSNDDDDVSANDLSWFLAERHTLDEALRSHGGAVLLERRAAGVPVGGLANQGATCYLNSLLQMLYAVPEFRAFVYRGWEYDPAVHGPPAVCIPLQLRLHFARMQARPRAPATAPTSPATPSSCL